MRRWWVGLLVAIACLTGAAESHASAPGNRLRLIYVPPGNPSFPSTQTINFGVKTLVGFGGSPMQYRNPQLLGLTRWLAITSQVDNASGVVNIFQLDDRQMLVPKNGAGAYGTSWGTPTAGPYTVTVAEYLDAAHTQPTGAQTTITVPIIANAAHAREMTSMLNGCTQLPCETTNPDGGTGVFNTAKWQINQTVGTGSAMVGGDTLYLRDGFFNPTNLTYTLSTLSSYGAGRITVTSETHDSTNDANGNPALKNGFKYGGGMVLKPPSNVTVPIDFTYLWCYVNQAAVVSPCLKYNSTQGSGAGFYFSRAEEGPAMGTTEVHFFQYRGPGVVDHNHIINMGKAITPPDNVTGGMTITNNICELCLDDFIDRSGPGNYVAGNFLFNSADTPGNHQDFMQDQTVGGTSNYGIVERNVLIVNDLSLTSDYPQFLFNNNGATAPMLNATFRNNIGNSMIGNMIYMVDFNAPTITNNTTLTVINSGFPATATGGISGTLLTFTTNPGSTLVAGRSITGTGVTALTVIVAPVSPWNGSTAMATVNNSQSVPPGTTLTIGATPLKANISVPTGKGGIDLSSSNNVSNAISYGSQGGTVTSTKDLILSCCSSASPYTTMFPNYVQGASPGVTNYAAALRFWTPANTPVASGGAVNPDGTISGALTPANDAHEVCWATATTVWDHTKTCAQMGLDVAYTGS